MKDSFRCSFLTGRSHSLSDDGHQFKKMAVGASKIYSTSAVPIIQLAVFRSPRSTADSDVLGFDAIQDRVKLLIADMKCIMAPTERTLISEK